MSEPFVPHHLPITAEAIQGNAGRGRLIFLPGSDGRARRISDHFQNRQIRPSDRQLNVYLGQISDGELTVDVGAISSGMGCPSLNIVVTELIGLGARLFIRIGSSGSVRPDTVRVGSLVIATCGVRNESTSDHYIGKDYPAIADPDMVAALKSAACKLGYGDRTYAGPVLAKDALYALEFGHGPRKADNEAYMDQMRAMRVLASDMETSHLFILSDAYSVAIDPLATGSFAPGVVKSGSIVAVIGDDSPFAPAESVEEAERMAIATGIEAALELFRTCD
ncbi:MAG: hypothetical protein JW797_08620 [Bradymonadales bacterium]|nr:hypothetical protein [Bradymonadales bacterium]